MTTIQAEPTLAKITDFIIEFFKMYDNGKYINKIDSLTGSNLIIYYYDLFEYQKPNEERFNLFELLNSSPKQFLELSREAIKSIYSERHGQELANRLDLTIQIDQSAKEISVNEAIKNKFINKLVTVRALVNGESEIQNRLSSGIWVCNEGHEIKTTTKPIKCNNNNCVNKIFTLDQTKILTESYRVLYLKDIEFSAHHSDTLIVEAVGELSDTAKTGDEVKIIGYITPEEIQRKIYNIFHAVNIIIVNKIDYQITEQDKAIFENWSKEPGFYNKAINSIAPRIYKSELNKEAFLLQYVGSPKSAMEPLLQRHWINVLAVGDPATAKSKIAQWANKTLPNVELVSSKAGSAKGLFAGQKEQIDGKKVLEIGPMVQCSNRGLLCIDEFARMEEVFDVFYTPMETGVFNSATVGGHANLNTETPIYATGNPKKSNRWDENRSIIDNLQVFEPSMLSRFDLIIITKDDSNRETDKEIANTILGLQNQEDKPEIFNEIDFAKYLLYCKTINPTLTKEISHIIADVFTDIRVQARAATTAHQEITARIVGTITRLTLAIARLNLHRETTEEDVSQARRLLENMYKQSGLKVSNANTYVDRIAQKIFKILEGSLTSLSDQEIHDKLFIDFEAERDTLLNDIGPEGPHRELNKRWRAIMESVEKSYIVEIESRKPRRLRYKHDQTRL